MRHILLPAVLLALAVSAQAADYVPTIYGNLIDASHWTTSDRPVGIYSFPAQAQSDGSAPEATAIAINSEINGVAGAVRAGDYYGIYDIGYMMGYYWAIYRLFDARTWTKVSETEFQDVANTASDLTYDATTGSIYGCGYNEEGTGYALSQYNIQSGYTRVVADISNYLCCIAASSTGELYGIDATGTLVRIDKQTGAFTPIGMTGIQVSDFSQSAAIDPRTGIFYWAAVHADESASLYQVSLDTGLATKLFDFAHNEEYVGIWIPEPEAADQAPAAISDLRVQAIQDQLRASVSGTISVTRYDGEPLADTTALVLHLLVGDQEVRTLTAVMPGASFSEEVVLPAVGQQSVTAYVSDWAGDGPRQTLSFWAGVDQPIAVGDLELSREGDFTAHLSWSAPTEGQHGGWVDAASLCYRIVRQPEGVVVADGISQTSFTEELSLDALCRISYDVTVFSGTTEGVTASSSGVVFGAPLEAPHSFSFDTEDDFSLFTIVDANDDDHTWAWSSTNHVAYYKYSATDDGDDWLLTPRFNLRADTCYTLIYSVRARRSVYPERYAVAMGPGQDVSAMTDILVEPTDVDWQSMREEMVVLRVPQDGDYSFGFYACSDADMMELWISDVHLVVGDEIHKPWEGIDIPLPSPEVQLSITAEGADIWWSPVPVIGEHDAEVPAADVSYSVIRSIDSTYVLAYQKAIEYDAQRQQFHYLDPEPAQWLTGAQQELNYLVRAATSAGIGESATSGSVLLGTPFTLPFTESFAGGAVTTGLMSNSEVNGAQWSLDTYNPADGDGGAARFAPTAAGQSARLSLGKVNVRGASHLQLSYQAYVTPSATDWLEVQVSTTDLTGFSTVGRLDYSGYDHEQWISQTLSLDGCLSADYVILGFVAHSVSGTFSHYVDAITLRNDVDCNLSVSGLQVQHRVKMGSQGWATADITNLGNLAAEGYAVVLRDSTRHGLEVARLDAGSSWLPRLAPGNTVTCLLQFTPDASWSDTTQLYLDLLYDADEEPGNNRTSDLAELIVRQPVLPTVADLTGSYDAASGMVSLSWTAPDPASEPLQTLTDGFEDYDAFEIENLGDWTLYDVDGGTSTYSIRNFCDYPHAGEPQAFICFRPREAGLDIDNSPTWRPHSGEQVMVAFHDADGANDNWLVTPELSGRAQTIGFWVRSATAYYGDEQFQLWYSTTDAELESFVQYGDGYEEVDSEWTYYEVELPEGTRYAGIRHITSQLMLGLLVDDFTYEAAGVQDAEILGYNVYALQGSYQRLNSELISATNCELQVPVALLRDADTLCCAVTVVYDLGESGRSESLLLAAPHDDAIRQLPADAAPVLYYDLLGRRVYDRTAGSVIVR